MILRKNKSQQGTKKRKENIKVQQTLLFRMAITLLKPRMHLGLMPT
jgi:hypothetical protein